MREWDAYWGSKDDGIKSVYDRIASVYRDYLIKPSLNEIINLYTNRSEILVHAGCGGGQVDDDISKIRRIVALDISAVALKKYRERKEGGVVSLLCADISELPFADESVEGIYNLGVMEHFQKEAISTIMREFARVLKKGGRVILFWPPHFGLSVIALRFIKSALRLFGYGKELHPAEPSLLTSRLQAERIFTEAGLELIDYRFGIKDFFTYAVLVGEKTD